MSRELTVTAYRPGDETAINRGFARVFGVDRPLDDWRWKFPDEAGGRRILTLRDPAGEVAAHFAALPVPLSIDGRFLRAGQVVDVYSDRRAGLARRGPFVRLVHEFYRRHGGEHDLPLIYGFPGERHFRLGVLALGYSPPRPVRFFSRDLATAPFSKPPRSSQLREGLDREAADALWRRAAHRYPVAVVRDGARLERRFASRPGVDYHHLCVAVGGEPAAWAVVRAMEGWLSWADLVWDGRPAALERLARAVETHGRRLRLPAGHLWLDGDPEAERLLTSLGWIERREPQGICLGAVSFTADLSAAELCRRLYVTMADADLV